ATDLFYFVFSCDTLSTFSKPKNSGEGRKSSIRLARTGLGKLWAAFGLPAVLIRPLSSRWGARSGACPAPVFQLGSRVRGGSAWLLETAACPSSSSYA
uniref:Uncharacterized protein n=1 Tax=Chelonoidis abingdonii TaxID=106734 RepID=A0A8C0JAJ6_CHEAB